MTRRILPALSLIVGLVAPLGLVACSEAGESVISVEAPYARETIGRSTTGAAYMTIANSGNGADRLIAASSPKAGNVEIHNHIKDGEVMRMRKIDGVDLPADETVAFKPGGLHIMMFDLAVPLTTGETVPLTLTFKSANTVTVDVTVVATGTSPMQTTHEADQMDHGNMGHSH